MTRGLTVHGLRRGGRAMPYLEPVPIDAAGAQPDDAYASTAPLFDLFPEPQGA